MEMITSLNDQGWGVQIPQYINGKHAVGPVKQSVPLLRLTTDGSGVRSERIRNLKEDV